MMVKKRISKKIRLEVFNKYNEHCAYCGNEITLKAMQVDHIVPIYRNHTDAELARMNITRGTNELSNYNPSCARCNRAKGTFTVEGFRAELAKLVPRLERYSNQFRFAVDFGLIEKTQLRVMFYFEYH